MKTEGLRMWEDCTKEIAIFQAIEKGRQLADIVPAYIDIRPGAQQAFERGEILFFSHKQYAVENPPVPHIEPYKIKTDWRMAEEIFSGE